MATISKEAYLIPTKGGAPVLIDGIIKRGPKPEHNEYTLKRPLCQRQSLPAGKTASGLFHQGSQEPQWGVRINGLKMGEGQLVDVGVKSKSATTDFIFKTDTQDIPLESDLPLEIKKSPMAFPTSDPHFHRPDPAACFFGRRERHGQRSRGPCGP